MSDVAPTWLDRAIAYLSPAAGLRRAKFRAASAIMAGHGERGRRRWGAYDGASKGRRTQGWKTAPSGANAELRGALSVLRDRSRDLVRNNAYATRGIGAIATNTVGTGIVAKVKGSKRLVDLWKAWAESTQCDAQGQHDLYGLQAIAMRAIAEGGEVLVRRRWRRPEDGLAVPLQLQVLEGDHLDSSKDGGLPNGGVIVQGVEFDAIGRRAAYWLFDDHPGDGTRWQAGPSRRIPAADVLHVYRVDRPGQVRGVPWLAPAIIRLRDFADYEDAQLLRQKIAACFTAFVHDIEAPDGTAQGKSGEPLEEIEPGIIEYLPPGKDVTFATPPSVSGYGEYARQQLGAIAATLGITYEELTGDLSNVNFSSGRMGWIGMARNIDAWRWTMLVPRLCDPVFGWFRTAAELSGVAAANVAARWTPPRREMIDPTKEVPAVRDAIRAGLVSLPEALRREGEDPDEVVEEIAVFQKRLDELGIVLDSDPRKTTRGGGSTAPAAPEPEEPAPTDPAKPE